MLDDLDDIGQYLTGKYFGYDYEVFSMLSLNAAGKVLGFDILSSGNVSEVTISLRDIVETVLKRKANCVVIAHNHPGGVALPSNEDVKMTEMIFNTLRTINVALLDHIIIVDDDYVSLRQSRCFNYMFEDGDVPSLVRTQLERQRELQEQGMQQQGQEQL